MSDLLRKISEAILNWWAPFAWSEKNPYERFCRKCGQMQVLADHWEPLGGIADHTCSCHRHMPRKFRPTCSAPPATRSLYPEIENKEQE